jgi:dTDP-4-amino-4,6-dideoxygalactose transaminase
MKTTAVPFFRPSIGEAEIAAVTECLRSGWLTTGPKTQEFEKAFEAYIGNGVTALAVNSATAALHLGLEALGVGPEDEVIVPTLTFTATAEVVRYLGATPVFVDIDPLTLCLDLTQVRHAITPKTKVIIPVHFGGRACDMTALRQLADIQGLFIMDDAAHALPTLHQGKLIGCNGADITAFSFYANKTMTTGEGGMLVTRDEKIASRVRTMRLHGIDRDVFNRFTNTKANWIYDIVAPGFKYNLTDIASALGVVQLGQCDEFGRVRIDLASRYQKAFADLPVILPPDAAQGDTHSWHLYLLQLSPQAPVNRDEFIAALRLADIGTSVHYRPLHQMTFWKSFCVGQAFPYADAYFDSCVSLPLFMAMTYDEQDYVIANVRRLLS